MNSLLRIYGLSLLLLFPYGYGCGQGFDPAGAGGRSKQESTPGSEVGQGKVGSGTAVLRGKVYQAYRTPARGATILAFRYDDYRDTLAVAFTDTLGNFLLSGLPEEQIDVIIQLDGFFPRKRSPVLIRSGENVLEGVLEGAVLLSSFDHQYNPQVVLVDFKPEIPRREVERILTEERMTIWIESEGTLGLQLPAGMTVPEAVERLIIRQEVKIIEPSSLSFTQ